ncbi:MAG: hypothetical protein ACF788_09265 [Novipirellula sp. JB048]
MPNSDEPSVANPATAANHPSQTGRPPETSHASEAGHAARTSASTETRTSPSPPGESEVSEAGVSEAGAGQPNTLSDPPPPIRQRRQELEVHLKSSPTDRDAFRELASIYRQEARPQEAKRVLTEALRIFPDDASVLWEWEEAKLARSLQVYREVRDLAARLNTSEVQRELNRSRDDWANQRIEVCQARLARDPSLDHLRLVLAEAYIDLEQSDKAIEELDALLESDECSPQAYLLRGKCLLSMGRDVEAMVALRAAGLRRAVVAPLPTRLAALRLLCETAQRLGIELTLEHYQRHLAMVEKEMVEKGLAKQSTAATSKRV